VQRAGGGLAVADALMTSTVILSTRVEGTDSDAAQAQRLYDILQINYTHRYSGFTMAVLDSMDTA
jgi:hypothetical protein